VQGVHPTKLFEEKHLSRKILEKIKYEYIYTQPEGNGAALYSGIIRFNND
jgi:hypothetical protein